MRGHEDLSRYYDEHEESNTTRDKLKMEKNSSALVVGGEKDFCNDNDDSSSHDEDEGKYEYDNGDLVPHSEV